jgi:hypothetical protein
LLIQRGMNPMRIPSLSFATLFAIAVTDLACQATRPASSVAVVAPAAPTRGAPAPRLPVILVWTRTAGGGARTWTLDQAGSVVANADEVRIAVRGALWAWRETPVAIATDACPRFDDAGNELPPGPPPSPGKGVRATLERVGGGGVDEVVAAGSGEGAEQIEQSVELVATVGPYLFLRESTFAYTCGVHGNMGAGYRVWDAEHAAVVWDSAERGREEKTGLDLGSDPLVLTARPLALAALGSDQDVTGFKNEDGSIDVHLTQVVPSYGRDAELALDLQFTAFTCYA